MPADVIADEARPKQLETTGSKLQQTGGRETLLHHGRCDRRGVGMDRRRRHFSSQPRFGAVEPLGFPSSPSSPRNSPHSRIISWGGGGYSGPYVWLVGW